MEAAGGAFFSTRPAPALVTSPNVEDSDRPCPLHLNVICPNLCPPDRPPVRETAAADHRGSLPPSPPPESEHASNRTAHPHTQKEEYEYEESRPPHQSYMYGYTERIIVDDDEYE